MRSVIFWKGWGMTPFLPCSSFCENFCFKEAFNRFGFYGMESIVNHYANTFLASAQAKCATELNLFFKVVFCYKVLKLFYNLTRTFDVARAAYTYCDFHFFTPFVE